jgi:hypothetical protein
MEPCEYLVVHGLMGEIDRYRAESAMALPRGTQVVVQGDRGLEIGEVVRPARPKHVGMMGRVGRLVRPASEADLGLAQARETQAQALVSRAEELRQELRMAVVVLDAEVQLAGDEGLLLYVQSGKGDIRDLISLLSKEYTLSLRSHDVAAKGCGDCGEGGCGSCGSGGCGTSCSAGSREEVSRYFADLREKMEARRVSLL